jgi:sulfur-oxidizing protein SoxB
LQYACDPTAAMGKRIQDMRLGGRPIEASKTYKVAGWAPVAEGARNAGNKPVWELVEQWLRAKNGTVAARRINMPRLTGGLPNAGFAGNAA